MDLSQDLPASQRIAYFFCQFDCAESLEAITILSSILKQLLDPKKLTAVLENELKAVLHSGALKSELKKLLIKALSISEAQYIFIDAVDECADSERKVLLDALGEAASAPNGKVKICISTRDKNVRHSGNLCHHEHWVSTHSPEAKSNLDIFIKHALEMKVDEEQLVVGDKQLIEEIHHTLLTQADGM